MLDRLQFIGHFARELVTYALTGRPAAISTSPSHNNPLILHTAHQALRVSRCRSHNLKDSLTHLVNPPDHHTTRSHALMHLADTIAPGFTRAYSTKLSPTHLKFVGHGHCHLVFKASLHGTAYAVKVNAHSQLVTPTARQRILTHTIAAGRTLTRWFKHIPGLIPPQQVAILSCPPFFTPAVVTLQPYLPGTKIDVFTLPKTKLLRLMQQYPLLHRTFTQFVQKLKRIYAQTHTVPDISSPGNLLIITSPNTAPQLVLPDTNYLITPSRLARWPVSRRALHLSRLDYLFSLL